MDPRTYYVHGTFAEPLPKNDPFIKSMEKTYNEEVTQIPWSGGNTKEARLDAAQKISDDLKNNPLKPDEKLNFVTHSHGGNVVKDLTNLDMNGNKINSIVQLGTPNRSDYRYNDSIFAKDATKINVYDKGDGVQLIGGPWIFSGRQESGFNNVEVHQIKPTYVDSPILGPRIENMPLGPIEAHSALRSADTWNKFVDPVINQSNAK